MKKEENTPEIKIDLFPTINLPNAIKGDIDFGKKIDIRKLHELLKDCVLFVSEFDLKKNPYQNFLVVNIKNLGLLSGKFWVYSNGTCKTKMPMANKYKLMVLDMWYRAYARRCFYD